MNLMSTTTYDYFIDDGKDIHKLSFLLVDLNTNQWYSKVSAEVDTLFTSEVL